MPQNDGVAKCIGPCERTLPLTHLRRCIFCDNYICTSEECSVEGGSEFYSCLITCSPRVEELKHVARGKEILKSRFKDI